MSRHKRLAQTQSDKQEQRRHKGGVASASPEAALPETASVHTLQAQATQLQNAQRQALAAQIGQTQGNQFLQRAIGSEASPAETQIQRTNDTVLIDWGTPVIPQESSDTCWAAATAMLLYSRFGSTTPSSVTGTSGIITPQGVAQGASLPYGRIAAVQQFNQLAQSWDLTYEPVRRPLTVDDLRERLASGPIVAGFWVPALHAVLVRGLRGDGTPDGTQVLYNDPELGRREESVRAFVGRFVSFILR